jgi:hypothetical protein
MARLVDWSSDERLGEIGHVASPAARNAACGQVTP